MVDAEEGEEFVDRIQNFPQAKTELPAHLLLYPPRLKLMCISVVLRRYNVANSYLRNSLKNTKKLNLNNRRRLQRHLSLFSQLFTGRNVFSTHSCNVYVRAARCHCERHLPFRIVGDLSDSFFSNFWIAGRHTISARRHNTG